MDSLAVGEKTIVCKMNYVVVILPRSTSIPMSRAGMSYQADIRWYWTAKNMNCFLVTAMLSQVAFCTHSRSLRVEK